LGWAVLIFLVVSPSVALGVDPFDRITRPVLIEWSRSSDWKPVNGTLSATDLLSADGLGKDLPGSPVIFKTSKGRWTKALLRPARQKLEGDHSVPILLVEKYATFLDNEERAVSPSGSEIRLFPGFRFSLELGQVVPPEVAADFQLTKDGQSVKLILEKETSLWVPKKPFQAPSPPKPPKIDATKPFGIHWFAGHFRLHDDGRRSGRLEIEVDKEGNLSGAFFSDLDNKRYELFGKVGMPSHTAQFTVRFPRTEQLFQATLFTGNGSALTGTSRFGERETGFYAIRIDD